MSFDVNEAATETKSHSQSLADAATDIHNLEEELRSKNSYIEQLEGDKQQLVCACVRACLVDVDAYISSFSAAFFLCFCRKINWKQLKLRTAER
jgi:hypothetical protein